MAQHKDYGAVPVPQRPSCAKANNSLYKPINEKLEALIHLTDEEIRKDVSAKRNFILSVLALSALILVLVLGIVSVAHATNKPIEPRIWEKQKRFQSQTIESSTSKLSKY